MEQNLNSLPYFHTSLDEIVFLKHSRSLEYPCAVYGPLLGAVKTNMRASRRGMSV